jgi:hypothetical protein
MSLKQIDSQKISKTINKPYIYTLIADKPALYVIEITASAKSWWQKFLHSFFSDDELYLKFNQQDYNWNGTKWNGNSLKNLQQTNVFVMYLEKGTYDLQLIPKHKPFLEQIILYQSQDNIIDFKPNVNNPAKDGNLRPWYNLILTELGLKDIAITASANKESNRDDDDIKIIIDNDVPLINESKKSHKYWYWCGKIQKGQLKELKIDLNKPIGNHTIQFFADRTPKLEQIKIEVKSSVTPTTQITIQPYNKIDKNNYNRFDAEILNAVVFWNNEFSKQKFPPDELLDPNLVKAVIYIETRIGYGSGSNQAYPDVMQVADERNPAIHTLNNDEWINPNTGKIARESEFVSQQEFKVLDYRGRANGNTSEQSIYWGVRWLYHKAQKFYGTGLKGVLDPPYIREWKGWKQAVMDYNDSPRKVEYQKEVWQLYENGIDSQGKRLW